MRCSGASTYGPGRTGTSPTGTKNRVSVLPSALGQHLCSNNRNHILVQLPDGDEEKGSDNSDKELDEEEGCLSLCQRASRVSCDWPPLDILNAPGNPGSIRQAVRPPSRC